MKHDGLSTFNVILIALSNFALVSTTLYFKCMWKHCSVFAVGSDCAYSTQTYWASPCYVYSWTSISLSYWLDTSGRRWCWSGLTNFDCASTSTPRVSEWRRASRTAAAGRSGAAGPPGRGSRRSTIATTSFRFRRPVKAEGTSTRLNRWHSISCTQWIWNKM